MVFSEMEKILKNIICVHQLNFIGTKLCPSFTYFLPTKAEEDLWPAK